MKIVFVGIHNKPGKAPLDSTTKTGEIIDAICCHFKGVEFMKANLFPIDSLPKKERYDQYVEDFLRKTQDEAYYILLGKTVGELLGVDLQQNSKCFFHPGFAIRKGKDFTQGYIDNIVQFIKTINA